MKELIKPGLTKEEEIMYDATYITLSSAKDIPLCLSTEKYFFSELMKTF